ncbi:pyridoxamine 5'-phosphate oxidase family protein [Streptomyces sp. L7]
MPLGRIGFTHRALPMIRPVNHIVDDDNIVIRTHTGSALLSKAPTEEVVVYEADHIDVRTRTGWSVMVTGRANRITAPLDVARYQETACSVDRHGHGARRVYLR